MKSETILTKTTAVPHWEPLQKLEFIATSCPLCQSTKSKLRFSKKIRDISMSYYICVQCKVLYSNPRASKISLNNLYASKDFFEGSQPGGDHLNYPHFIEGENYLRLTARDRLKRIRKYCLEKGKMLEVASAAGFFLIEAMKAGYDISGVEFSRPLAQYASARWNIPVIPASIEEIDLQPESYDAIASWGVMTIIQDPIALMKKFQKALRPKGIWAFNTYYYEGIWPKIVNNRWDILTVNFSQIYTQSLLIKTVCQNGFRLLSKRREQPYTDLVKIADKLVQNLNMEWLLKFINVFKMDKFIIKIPLPDVMEYIFQKE